MIFDITEENIRAIHIELENKFPLMQKGVEKEGLIQALIEKQNRILFGSENPYDTIYLKAAVLTEGLIRWHIFTDGNKRTALMSTFIYLRGNKHYLAIPIDSVRFLIKIADTRENDEDSTNKLIKEIADWLHEYSATEEWEFFGKVGKYNTLPALKVNLLYFFGFRKKAKKITDYWYAIDTGHTDYIQEAQETSKLIRDVMTGTVTQLYHTLRMKKKNKPRKLQDGTKSV
ncbi:MAG: type II toxin-antitoxin system death-on-curing family toxin [Nitrosotalea sp.]